MATKLRSARAVKPGNILRRELEARSWTQKEFAEIIGRPPQMVNEVIAGKKIITPETAILFAEAFGTSAELWLNLENSYRLRLAESNMIDSGVAKRAALYEAAPYIKDMIMKGWIEKKTNIEELTQEFLRFFSVDSLQQAQQVGARFRISGNRTPEQAAQVAWLRRVEIVASNLDVEPYSPDALRDALPGLRRLSIEHNQVEVVRKRLAELGVRMVVVPHLSKTYVDGAAFWLNPESPVIALSLRHKRIDNFWFTLMHELAHILLHADGGTHSTIDEKLEEDTDDVCEQEANRAASEWLISTAEFQSLETRCKGRWAEYLVLSFSEHLGVHPGIVVGRIRHTTHNYKLLSKYIKPICDSADLERMNQAA